ncbi:unnamed protein product [Microthlaspi erraticum]|uniref:Retroviral polymerase SH3-like domain-containing protein n=1 Tax=Microthlaspi erraticum TaxID=1685480 RepID=A0A6D2L6S8_9BRAS|nr:unnamed protein product [Microthlaspi erraticum]
MFRGKKPILDHIRIFGCIGYAKVEKPQLKKLDDRSRVLVHLGTEPGSKAYRLLEPQGRKIIVSRDVVFDESKGWNWSHSNSAQGDNKEFKVIFGEFGNRGIQEIWENDGIERFNGETKMIGGSNDEQVENSPSYNIAETHEEEDRGYRDTGES